MYQASQMGLALCHSPACMISWDLHHNPRGQITVPFPRAPEARSLGFQPSSTRFQSISPATLCSGLRVRKPGVIGGLLRDLAQGSVFLSGKGVDWINSNSQHLCARLCATFLLISPDLRFILTLGAVITPPLYSRGTGPKSPASEPVLPRTLYSASSTGALSGVADTLLGAGQPLPRDGHGPSTDLGLLVDIPHEGQCIIGHLLDVLHSVEVLFAVS